MTFDAWSHVIKDFNAHMPTSAHAHPLERVRDTRETQEKETIDIASNDAEMDGIGFASCPVTRLYDQLFVTPDRTRKLGRPRIYATPAARQAAYRTRRARNMPATCSGTSSDINSLGDD